MFHIPYIKHISILVSQKTHMTLHRTLSLTPTIQKVDKALCKSDKFEAEHLHRAQHTIPLIYSWKEIIITMKIQKLNKI